MVLCTRPGCGADFTAAGPCHFHPGAPVFHEGSKSWSCCRDRNKPVLEFDEFLLIPGCAQEPQHSDVKRPKETFSKPEKTSAANEVVVDAKQSTPASTVTPMSASRLAAVHSDKATERVAEPAAAAEEEDPERSPELIQPDAQCKRTGCKAVYKDDAQPDRSSEKCLYHPKVAIFHEGSKGYSCCKRRVLEFDEFLTIQGCTAAKSGHLFVGGIATRKKAKPLETDGPGVDEEEVDCRIDHYETPSDVRVTIYAKGVDMERSKIDIRHEEVVLSLALPALPATPNNLRRYNKTLRPFAAIDPEASTFQVTRFKIDLVLVKKARGESWPVLERSEKVYGYGLTFGRKLDA